MVGIVIVSHSAKLADGVKELAMQMASKDLKILTAGGLADGSIGTDAVRIQNAIEQSDSGEGVCILADLGSGILSTQTALEFLDDDLLARTRIADAPIAEGAISAAVSASIGSTLDEVVGSAEEARGMQKL